MKNTTKDGGDMTETQHDNLMDVAQECLVKGLDQEIVAEFIADEYGYSIKVAKAIVTETATHPITKILVKLAS